MFENFPPLKIMTLTLTRMYPPSSKAHGSKAHDRSGFLAFWKTELEKLSSAHILHWAVDAYYPRLALRTAFEPEGCVILSMLSNIVPKVKVLCHAVDYQMQRFWNVSNRFRIKTGLEIEPVYLHDVDLMASGDGIVPFDAVLHGTRRDGRPGFGVLDIDWSLEIPSIAPLARWTGDAVERKLRQDAIVDPSFVNIWRPYR